MIRCRGLLRRAFVISVLSLASGLVVSAASASPSSGPLSAVDVSVSGKARLRYEDTQGYGTAPTSFSRTSFWSIRIRPQVTFKLLDKTTIVLEPQFAKALGRPYSYTVTDSSGYTNYNENFHAHQGYVLLNLDDGFSFKAGRFSVNYGGQLILSPGEWAIGGRAFDGLMFGFKNDLVTVDLAHLKVASSLNKIDEDRDLNVLYSQWNLVDWLKAFEAYALYESNQVGGLDESRFGAGLRAKAKFDAVDVGGEYTHQNGTKGFIARDEATAMIVAEAGYTFENFSKLRAGLEFNQADDLWAEWYPLNKSPLGRNDVVGRRNLTAYALRLSAEPSDYFKVTLDYWMFSRTKTSATPYRTNSTTQIGSAATSSASDIGQSIEASALYKASDRLEYGIGFAYFIQGEYLKKNFGDRELTDFYAVANLTF